MNTPHGVGDADRQTQEGAHLHGLAEQPIERLASGVFEHQNGATLVPRKRERPRSPLRIELGRQRILVLETSQRLR